MAKTSTQVAAGQEPPLSFAEFYDAALAAPELAVYIIRVNANGHFTFEDANGFVAKVAGKPLSEIRGRPVGEVLHPEIAQCVTGHLLTVVETGEPLAYQRTFDFPHGRLSFKTSLIPIRRGPRGVQYVLGLTRDATEEINLFEHAQHQAALLQTLGLTLPSAVYLLDMEQRNLRFIGGEARATQMEWRHQAEGVGAEGAAKFFHPEDWPRVQAHWDELAALKDGEVCTISYRLFTHEGEYRRHVHRETVFSRDSHGKVAFVLGISDDVSEQDKVQQEVRDLSAHMLTLQIEERRRIAQELHDSTGQHLTAVSLAVGNARAAVRGGRKEADLLAAMDDAAECLVEAQREIRVLSYLLHPPELRSNELGPALEKFAEGFARRASFKVSVNIDPEASNVDDDAAVHLFRVCQEALTNVYRHAHAHKVSVTLATGDTLRLTVKDDGIGFNASGDHILGLGLPGMRERMARLGGTVEISANPSGTTLVATVPRWQRAFPATEPGAL